MNPYAVLGLRKHAAAADIRAAYRKLSKTAHPDAGGDAEAFARIKLAHEVLMDPARRWKYDTTGSIDPTEVDNTHVAVMQLLGEWLDAALAKIVGRRQRVENNDLIAEMRGCVGEQRRLISQQRSALLESRPNWVMLASRFNAKKGPNRLAEIVHSRIAGIDRQLQAMSDVERKISAAAALLDDYVFRRDTALWLPSAGFFIGERKR